MLSHVKTFIELKTEYWRLSKVYHPDSGGDKDQFIALHDAKKAREVELAQKWQETLSNASNMAFEQAQVMAYWQNELDIVRARITGSPKLVADLYTKKAQGVQNIINQIQAFGPRSQPQPAPPQPQPVPQSAPIPPSVPQPAATKPKRKAKAKAPQPQQGPMFSTPNTTYQKLDLIVNFFIDELFGGTLPAPMVKFANKPGMIGSMSYQKVWQSHTGQAAYEMCLNPVHFNSLTLQDVCSTITCELCHLWQSEYGKPSGNGYHNQEWAAKMKEKGLEPITANGKGTGSRATHNVIQGGLFEQKFQLLVSQHPTMAIDWFDGSVTATTNGSPSASGNGSKSKSDRQKFSCPNCKTNAWAKPSANLVCGACMTHMQLN